LNQIAEDDEEKSSQSIESNQQDKKIDTPSSSEQVKIKEGDKKEIDAHSRKLKKKESARFTQFSKKSYQT